MDTLMRKINQDTTHHISDPRIAEKQLAEYQKNMKIFIQAVEKQMALTIDKYQNQIKQLKNQIQRLKRELNGKAGASTGFDFGTGFQSHMSQCFSPIKNKGASTLLGGQTVRSNFFEEMPAKNFFDNEPQNFFGMTQSKLPQFDGRFDIKNSPDKMNKSRFEMQSKKKRQRQQDLLHFLEMGKSNLDLNTDKMFGLIGKAKQIQKKDEQNEQENQNTSPTKKKSIDAHNSSLNSICDSLNNSFHGKKAQQKSAKKRKQQQSKQLQELRKQQQRQKFKKQQGIKNLLTTMRKNVSHSLDKPQIIKGSKLLTTGQKGKSVQTSTRAKVMINPVPVDLGLMNKQKQHNSMTTSPSKNPQSILKNSSNVLTKSIQNISAISFYSSGGQQ